MPKCGNQLLSANTEWSKKVIPVLILR